MANSPQIHELGGMPKSGKPDPAIFFSPGLGNSRRKAYKGGRKLPSAEIFENHLLVVDKSLGDIERKLQIYARESTSKRKDGIIINFPDGYLKGYLQELVYGRYKSPGWFTLLLSQSGISLPWWTQYDGETEARK
jgi:hypothetical protein